MGLYERLMGVDPVTHGPKVPLHLFVACLGEFARGRVTGPQAQAAIAQASGQALAAPDAGEAQALLATITGTATARLARAREVDDVLQLAEAGAAPYDTPAAVRTRLGV